MEQFLTFKGKSVFHRSAATTGKDLAQLDCKFYLSLRVVAASLN